MNVLPESPIDMSISALIYYITYTWSKTRNIALSSGCLVNKHCYAIPRLPLVLGTEHSVHVANPRAERNPKK
jgi:hypothetical protein